MTLNNAKPAISGSTKSSAALASNVLWSKKSRYQTIELVKERRGLLPLSRTSTAKE